MKRKFRFLTILMVLTIFTFYFLKTGAAFAVEENRPFEIKAKAAYLCDYDTQTVLYAYNENARLPIASMVKIMTLILCYEHIDSGGMTMDDMVTVSENAASMGGSQAFLDARSQYKVSDLLKSIVVASANDSCVALAEHICGSVEAFVQKMNQKAKELNLQNTNFVNCTGLPAEGSYSCAKDVSVMLGELIKHKEYFLHSKIWMDKIIHKGGRETELTNTNKLSRFYEGCDGGKTGYTTEALHCLSATAKRNNLRLIGTVIGAPDSKTRFAEVSKLFNYGFANYENKIIVSSQNAVEQGVEVIRGKKKYVQAKPEQDIAIFKARSDELKSVEVKQENYVVNAPVKEGDIVGKITVIYDGQPYKTVNLIACENIERKGYKDNIKDMLEKWTS
ncbi:MAG TPA: D-alanyl-D-alanine carboxypeptidase family protein [Clostridia bacterium]